MSSAEGVKPAFADELRRARTGIPDLKNRSGNAIHELFKRSLLAIHEVKRSMEPGAESTVLRAFGAVLGLKTALLGLWGRLEAFLT